MTREEKQNLNTTSKKCRIIAVVSLCLMLILGLAKMMVANRAATWGSQVEAVESQAEAVKQENLRLKTELATKGGGLESLAQSAQSAGFTSEVEVLYFNQLKPVALSLP